MASNINACVAPPGLLSKADKRDFQEAREDSLGFAGSMVLAALPHGLRDYNNCGISKNFSHPVEPEYKMSKYGYLVVVGISHGSTTIIFMCLSIEDVGTQYREMNMALSTIGLSDFSRAAITFYLDPLNLKTMHKLMERSVVALFPCLCGMDKKKAPGVLIFTDIYGLMDITHNLQFPLPSEADTWYFPEREGSMAKKPILTDVQSYLEIDSNNEVTSATSHHLIPTGIPKELLDVWEIIPEHEKTALIKMDPDLRISFIRSFRVRLARRDEEAKIQGEEIRQAIMPGGQPPPEQLRFSFSPFPTQLTRTSPFFPLSTQEMANREFMRDMVIASHSWGTLTYSGPKLSVYEEDYLMILLALLCDANARIEEAGVEGETTYTYNGNIRQILKLKGIENPGANYYKLVIDAFTLLSGASFKLTTKKPGKGKREAETTYVNNILSNFVYKHGSGDIKVSVNPYFYQTYGQGMVTWLDVQIRSRLKNPHSKALYRFIMSHRDDLWEGPLLTLAASANIDLNLPKFKIRERLKKAIGELIEVGVLIDKSKINADLVELWRTPRKTAVPKKIC